MNRPCMTLKQSDSSMPVALAFTRDGKHLVIAREDRRIEQKEKCLILISYIVNRSKRCASRMIAK